MHRLSQIECKCGIRIHTRQRGCSFQFENECTSEVLVVFCAGGNLTQLRKACGNSFELPLIAKPNRLSRVDIPCPISTPGAEALHETHARSAWHSLAVIRTVERPRDLYTDCKERKAHVVHIRRECARQCLAHATCRRKTSSCRVYRCCAFLLRRSSSRFLAMPARLRRPRRGRSAPGTRRSGFPAP